MSNQTELVKCLYRNIFSNKRFLTEEEMWIDLELPDGYSDEGRPYYLGKFERLEIVPIYDNLHDDKENGQQHKHYHRDTRYILSLELREKYIMGTYHPRPMPDQFEGIIEVPLIQIYPKEYSPTPKFMIPSYKGMKLNCLTCPHRGFDLTNTKPDKRGIITCPLHSTEINVKTMTVL